MARNSAQNCFALAQETKRDKTRMAEKALDDRGERPQ